MNVCVTLMHRFDRTPDGAVWTNTNHTYEEARRYLDVFSDVRLLARIREVQLPPDSGLRADGEGVSFAPLPYWIGFEQFCLQWNATRRAVLRAIGNRDAVILKAPSIISSLIEPALRKQGRPFGAELLSDPWGLYAKGSVSHPLRPLLRWIVTKQAQSECRHACSVRYVSDHLRNLYPPSPDAFRVAVSDVHLSFGAPASRRIACAPTPLRLIAVGSLEQPVKGIDVLLRAVRMCRDRDVDCRLAIVGEGRLRPGLTELSRQLGIEQFVDFKGFLPSGERVMAALEQSDIFVMPSRQEGMPRAMIEAMACALPCIGSAVGGIPELLDEIDLTPPGDPGKLAAKIIEVGSSPQRMEQMSERCRNRARRFEEHQLRDRFGSFLRHLRGTTESWAEGSRSDREAVHA